MSATYTIDSGIAMPSKAAPKRESKFPVAAMQPGQSFFIPKGGKSQQISVLKAFKNAGKHGATRNVTELVDGVETPGLRVWCVEAPAKDAAAAE